jgi:hypothetical protein
MPTVDDDPTNTPVETANDDKTILTGRYERRR